MQAAQAVHAAFAYAAEHPGITREWLTNSNFLVVVSVTDEFVLLNLLQNAHKLGITHSCAHEPDLDDTLTAVALEPGATAKRLCANYPLALKEHELV